MAVPVIDTANAVVHTDSAAETEIVIAKPASTVVDNSLVFIGCGNWNNPTDGWNSLAGWNQVKDHFSNTSDLEIGVYWRKITGSEGSTFTFPTGIPAATSRLIGVIFQVSLADGDDLIAVMGSDKVYTALSSHTVDEVTTPVDDCLGISVFGFHGTDGAPVGTGGTGWTEQWEIYGGGVTGNGGYPMLVVSQKDVPSAGLTGDCTHTTAVADRGCSFQFAIRPAASEVVLPLGSNFMGPIPRRGPTRVIGY